MSLATGGSASGKVCPLNTDTVLAKQLSIQDLCCATNCTIVGINSISRDTISGQNTVVLHSKASDIIDRFPG
jgi:hypothetical protein